MADLEGFGTSAKVQELRLHEQKYWVTSPNY